MTALATVPELDTRSVVSVEDEPEAAAECPAGEPEPQHPRVYGALPPDRGPRQPLLTQNEKRFYRKQTQALVQCRYVHPRRDRVRPKNCVTQAEDKFPSVLFFAVYATHY